MSAENEPAEPMPPAPRTFRAHRVAFVIYAAIGIAVFAADQISKRLVEKSIPLHSFVTVIPHFFNLTYTSNQGAAFGLFSQDSSPWKTVLLIGVSVILLVAVVAVVWRNLSIRREAGVALALILGGAASNLLDRIRDGRVVDFLDFYFRDYHWFTFNVADSAIVVGACLLVIHLLLTGERGT
ncbi:MAG: signal peptidase II [Acidobacteriota bacterium]|nr:signal peptidase II [Acidobacteriota bacterium]